MDYYGTHITKLIEELSRLPGVGGKTAQRLAFHIINLPEDMANQLAKSIVLAKRNTRYCEKCFTITDKELCPICASEKRNGTTIMVVEQSKDLAAYERTREFKGLYHVLQGAISPMIGVGPNDIKVRELLIRLQKEDIVEVILATSSTAEGEATATYHSMLIKPIGINVTRIANGVPVGGDLEYIDEITLLRALEGRIEL
ncbi:MAG: recombination mediator RecR [Vallitaleaceae bacterium]|jgi:recombination protein RecR|nr:recombination mediator RecR [Vallitaleaceae bacterium]